MSKKFIYFNDEPEFVQIMLRLVLTDWRTDA